jgi:hypothetical protein
VEQTQDTQFVTDQVEDQEIGRLLHDLFEGALGLPWSPRRAAGQRIHGVFNAISQLHGRRFVPLSQIVDRVVVLGYGRF